ncbi:MAG: glycine--tRNA ligase subunit beta [Pseudomonadota bacterium]|nr:glycine--tRNA ligase subunit beta [Pseudomonadota bacterium]
MAELLFEIFSEEIPARMGAFAKEELKRLVIDGLNNAGLKYSEAHAYVTPRRLVLVIQNLSEYTPDVFEERRGPKISATDHAIAGFKGSLPKGANIEIRETAKGKFYFANFEKKGIEVAKLLSEILIEVLSRFPWPRSMRWADKNVRWVRPIRSILCVFNGTVVDFDFGLVATTNTSYGHRFYSAESFEVKDFSDYKRKLKKAHVVLDPSERRDLIASKSKELADKSQLILKDDPQLLDEVVGLVEWPVVYIGSIDKCFMSLPDEVLSTAMRKHQKYFSLTDNKGKLSPNFIIVANMKTSDSGKAVIAGNERVLSARLSDAKFYWDQDLKESLNDKVKALSGRIFHEKIGSVLEKVGRIERMASVLSKVCGADAKDSKRAAHLAKADLSTGMVAEFPDLQGVIGRYYALADGEKLEVADAIAEHYLPQGPGATCPIAPVSIVVALADKIDTLVSFWSINEKPTGSKDPFGLRRTALGIIRLILENKIRLNLVEIFKIANDKVDTIDLLTFLTDRLKVYLRGQGVPYDHIDAVYSLGQEDDLVRLIKRVEALGEFLKSKDGSNLLIAYRRAANILKIEEKKDGLNYNLEIDDKLLEETEEKALFGGLNIISVDVDVAIADECFDDAMNHLSRLRSLVDQFFDKVTVNADREELRINRLRLLSEIRSAIDRVADFSMIEGADR